MVPLSGPLAPTTQAEIRAALEAYMKDAELSQADVAEAIGQNSTYMNNLLTQAGNLPAATRDRMLRDINNWLEREERARAAQRPEDFVRITVAPKLFALCEQLTERADMAIAYGPAGIGKSISIDAIVGGEIPTAVAIRAGHETRTNCKLIRAIHQVLTGKRLAAKIQPSMDAIVEKLRLPAKVKVRALLIIDQAHELRGPAYRVLMEIHDRAACSVLLVGTIDLKAVASTDDSPELGQFSSRIGMRINLAPGLGAVAPGSKRPPPPFVTASDIRKLFAWSKLKLHPDVVRMLARIANEQRGTVRRAKRLFYWAEQAALKGHVDTITLAHLQTGSLIVEREFALPEAVESGAAQAQEAVG